jgi:hypothetical protein
MIKPAKPVICPIDGAANEGRDLPGAGESMLPDNANDRQIILREAEGRRFGAAKSGSACRIATSRSGHDRAI